ncbi:MAG: T9SS type A sorting domain-containing protein, partial [Candidatus Latescibacteria bacterium]|nr:T9SS type A sorting domain-containing protein [Candidatus Latescibacterota bacterium]
RDTDVFSYKPVKIDTVLPAGESLQWEQAIDTGYYFYPGEYTLAAGLSGYESEVSTGFTIDDTEIFGTVSGTLLTYADDGSTMIPIGGATVDVWSEPRRKPMPYITDDYDPNQEMLHWNTVTDSDGYFIFEEVPVWWFYTVDIRKDGYTPFTESFMNSKGQYVLKPVIKRILEEAPLNYRYTKIDDLEVSIGTSSSIYDPQSVFKGHLTVLNHGVEPISFEFEDNHYITWTFASEYGDMYEIRDGKICINPREGYDNSAYENIGSTIVIEPGDSWTFTLADSLDTLLPVRTGIYKFNGSLAFVSSSNERLNPGEVSCSLKFLVEKSTYTRIDTNIDDDKYVVDLQDSLHTTLDLYMKGYASGEIHLTEFCENPYDSIKDHNFIKIVDIDIDSGIRANIDHALVKIYFDPDDYQNPQNLVIAHWKEEEQITGDVPPQKSTGNWEILETTVDLDNNCAEAYTTTFSSFGLFESYEPTAVDEGMKPDRFALLQNQPNPFNPSTTLSFTLPDAGDTRLIVYNVSGQEVARLVDGPMPAGTHQVVFDALQMASGVYFYRIVCNGFTATKRMMFVR